MNHCIYRSYEEPKREGITWEERWNGQDGGLINCWEAGRELSNRKPELSQCAKNGELPRLGWKGGASEKANLKERYGTLNYLAQWQALRGEDLNIDLSEEVELICSGTGTKTIFTADEEKFGSVYD